MQFIADFHIHSKYSRATSKNMDIENIAQWAKLKGIQLMGTGDWTHHLWLEELKSKLESKGDGLYIYNGVNFILTAEISSIYSKRGKGYRIHNLIFAPSFKTVDKINSTLSGYGNLASDGRPILGMDAKELAKIIFDIDENCLIVPAHAWTPWFSIFGSMSGFNSIEECFEELTPKIFAVETGLSSNPQMNWRLSMLDNITLISNSDSHSPQKIGREANVFNCELNYNEIVDVLKKKDKNRFLYTIEFFPEEGKYHYDGHRLCGISFSPKETKAHKGLCPKCGRRLTVGVMNRVDELADREDGFVPTNAIPFKSLVPLDEIIANAKNIQKNSVAVGREYHAVLARLGAEFEILAKISKEELYDAIPAKIAEGIIRVREGKLKVIPGFDGEYGKVDVFFAEEKNSGGKEEQLSFF